MRPDELEDTSMPNKHEAPESLSRLPGVHIAVAEDVWLFSVHGILRQWKMFRPMKSVSTSEIAMTSLAWSFPPPPLSLSHSLTSPHGITADLLRVDDISGWDMPVEN